MVGRYKVIEALGQGGMGVVYRAEDPFLDRIVAIKVMHPRRMTAEAKERMMREARAVARLDSPHVVRIWDLDTYPDGNKELLYIVMEYVKGQTLSAMIEGAGAPGREVLRQRLGYYSQLLDAMSYAHGEGVVHRDLKPENVMVSTQGRVKVMDFGLAVLDDQHSQTRDNQIMGTLAYFAPEQARGGTGSDARCDIYALGVILFELATGQLPFTANNPLEFIHKVLHEPAPSLTQINPEVPPGLEKLALRALRKDPNERQATVLDMARELETVLQAWSAGSKPPAPAAVSPPRTADLPPLARTSSPMVLPPVQIPIIPPPPSLEATRSELMERWKRESQTGAGPTDFNATRLEGSAPSAEPLPPPQAPATPSVMPFSVTRGRPIIATDGWVNELQPSSVHEPPALHPMVRDDRRQQELNAGPEADAPQVTCSGCGARYYSSSLACPECAAPSTPSYFKIKKEARQLANQSAEALTAGDYELALDLAEQALAHDAELGEPHLCRGRALLGLGRLSEAIYSLERACEGLPKSPQPYLVMAEVYREQGDFEGLIACLLEALQRDPMDLQARLRLAYLLAETGRPGEAMDHYRRVLERSPRNAEANRQMGLLLARGERFEDATRYLEQANQLDPEDAQSCLMLGRLYARRKQFAAAQEAFETVIQLRGDDASLRSELSAVHQAQGKEDLAIRELKRALELDGTNREARLRLSGIYEKHGRLDLAARELEEALRFQPHDLGLNRRLGELYLQRNDLNRAMQVFENVVRLDPRCAEMHNQLGRIYLKKDYTQKSIDQYREAVQLHKVDPAYREDLAMAHYANGDFPAAIAELQRASMLDGQNPDYAKALGLLFYNVGDDEEAIRKLQFAASLNPQDSQTQGILGQALARRGGLTNLAVGAFSKALQIDPSNSVLYLYQARALAQAGRHADAVVSFRRFAERLGGQDDAFYLAATQVEMGMSYLAAGDPDRASEVLGLALKSNPKDARALHGLARVAMERQNWADARDKLRRAFTLEPKNRDFLITQSELQGLEGHWSEAALTLQRVVSEHPNEPQFYELLGRALRRSGRLAEAAGTFRRGADLFPRESGRFYWLEARLEARRGRHGEAATLFRRALERLPDHWRIYADLAETCQALGETREALSLVDKALGYAPAKHQDELKRLQLVLQSGRS